MLQAEHVCFRYTADRPILEDVSFKLDKGDVLCLLGPNGAGKTTLLRCLLGLAKPTGGHFLWENEDLTPFSIRKRARLMAYVPQASALTFPYEVREVVLMGRIAHLRTGSAPGEEDRKRVQEVLEQMNIAHLASDVFQHLSGGEKQLVLIARALAQQARLLVLDEPTASLDFANQVRTLQMIRNLSNQGYAVLMTSHSPDHAFLIANKVILIRDGTVFGAGSPDETITEDALSRLYGTQAKVFAQDMEATGKKVKVCIPVIEG